MESLFSVGQNIVCVDSKSNFGQPSGLVEGKQYRVTAIIGCACGIIGICVGVKETYFKTISCSCGRSLGPTLPERTFSQYRFVPLDTNSQLEEEIHQAMKGNLIEN